MLSKGVSEREAAYGAPLRIKATRFSSHKTLHDFNFVHQLHNDRYLIAHLGESVFLS